MRPYGIMFHHFHDDRHPRGQGSLSADQLADMIEFLGPHRILSARLWQERAADRTLREGDLCLTFDDSLRCQYDVAYPVLRDYGLTAFWFVYTSVLRGGFPRMELYRRFRDAYFDCIDDFYRAFFKMLSRSGYQIDMNRAFCGFDANAYLADFPFYTEADRWFRYVRDELLTPQWYQGVMDNLISAYGVSLHELAGDLWMDADCLRRLHADGHVIGLHSHTHPMRMAKLDLEAQEREYRTNRDQLARLIGERPAAMSHPLNSYNVDTLRILRKLGIALGFRSNLAQPTRSELEYPREDHTNVLEEMQPCESP